ncbi:hypothetical protein ACRAWF_08130 [Streptomyces sp. L7]
MWVNESYSFACMRCAWHGWEQAYEIESTTVDSKTATSTSMLLRGRRAGRPPR